MSEIKNIPNHYGIIEQSPGEYLLTRNGIGVVCPHIPLNTRMLSDKDTGYNPDAKLPQQNIVMAQSGCSSNCAKFGISKKGDKHLFTCGHSTPEIARELNPGNILLQLAPEPPAEGTRTTAGSLGAQPSKTPKTEE